MVVVAGDGVEGDVLEGRRAVDVLEGRLEALLAVGAVGAAVADAAARVTPALVRVVDCRQLLRGSGRRRKGSRCTVLQLSPSAKTCVALISAATVPMPAAAAYWPGESLPQSPIAR